MGGVAFFPPSDRAGGQDLTIAISPLGLVELADEEFEVHGPRLNRYSVNWAHYLGYHWAYKREAGESQLTFNWTKAFADYLANFQFGKGIQFRTPEATEAIAIPLYKRVWEIDNEKEAVLQEVGQLGGVSGDVFVKVAYEDAYIDTVGRLHPGRCRIIPLNPAFCFPEFHPQDRSRLIRFKLKYRFWGCVDPETEALTRRGWKRHDEITTDDQILALDPVTDEVRWEDVQAVSVYHYSGDMHRWTGKVDALTTPNHRWLGETRHGRAHTLRYEREIQFSGMRQEQGRLITGGGTPLSFADSAKWSDDFVELVAWFVTEGWWHLNQTQHRSAHLAQKKPEFVSRIRRLATVFGFNEYKPKTDGVIEWYVDKTSTRALLDVVGADKQIPPEFLCSLTYAQARMFYETLLDGDGNRTHKIDDRVAQTVRWTQLDASRQASFQMLLAMLGKRSAVTSCGEKVQEYVDRYTTIRNISEEIVQYDGDVWCPTVASSIWLARRNGTTYWTGNTSLEGTRSVFTYVEYLTDDTIEEYINDELISQRPNPLGTIPISQIQNEAISGSPWGLSDITDIVNINREYNTRATAMADTLNYHAEPVTIITGAKASNLEKGSKKVWGGLPENAKVFNLEGVGNLAEAFAFLELLKKTMHELTGVPQSALGETQPISNTSGVALSMTYMPLMMKWNRKRINYTRGLLRVNELVMLTLALKEPTSLFYNPDLGVPLTDDNYAQLDPSDPLTFKCEIHWPPPLPLDVMMKLQEIQAKMALGLTSKRGALRDLGYESPQQVLREVFEELIEDAKDQGALDIIRAQIIAVTGMITGEIQPETQGGAGAGSSETSGPGVPSPTNAPMTAIQTAVLAPQVAEIAKLFEELVQRAEVRTPSRSEPQNET